MSTIFLILATTLSLAIPQHAIPDGIAMPQEQIVVGQGAVYPLNGFESPIMESSHPGVFYEDGSVPMMATEEYSDQLTSLFESVKAKVPEKDRQEIESELEQWDFDLEKTKIDAGTLFQFSLPPELEVDALVRPGFLIANNNIVASLLQKHAEDLSQPRTPDLFGPAAEKKPSSMIFFYDNRVVMKGIETWNELALEFAEEAALEQDITFDLSQYEAERDTLQFSEEQLKDYVQHYWNLSNCWKGFSARSFDDGAGRASEFLLKFSDIEPVK